MPIYGTNKIKTMQRSILPSQARHMARYRKTKLVRRNRRPVKALLNSYYHDWDDLEVDLTYWEGPNRYDYGDIISWRRGADKLAHFEVWAYHKTKHLRVEDRYSKMAGILPNGVIGNHALSHLDFLKPPHPAEYWRWDSEDDYWDLPHQLRQSYRSRFVKSITLIAPDMSDGSRLY